MIPLWFSVLIWCYCWVLVLINEGVKFFFFHVKVKPFNDQVLVFSPGSSSLLLNVFFSSRLSIKATLWLRPAALQSSAPSPTAPQAGPALAAWALCPQKPPTVQNGPRDSPWPWRVSLAPAPWAPSPQVRLVCFRATPLHLLPPHRETAPGTDTVRTEGATVTTATATGARDTAGMIATETGIGMATETGTDTVTETATAAAAIARVVTEMEAGGTERSGGVREMGETGGAGRGETEVEMIVLPSLNHQSVERAGGTTKEIKHQWDHIRLLHDERVSCLGRKQSISRADTSTGLWTLNRCELTLLSARLGLHHSLRAKQCVHHRNTSSPQTPLYINHWDCCYCKSVGSSNRTVRNCWLFFFSFTERQTCLNACKTGCFVLNPCQPCLCVWILLIKEANC